MPSIFHSGSRQSSARPVFTAVRVDHREPPHVLCVEAEVVHDLDVVGVGAEVEEELRELVASRMRRPVFFAFAGDAGHRGVVTVAGVKERVGIGARVEQQARDRDGVVIRRAQSAGA